MSARRISATTLAFVVLFASPIRTCARQPQAVTDKAIDSFPLPPGTVIFVTPNPNQNKTVGAVVLTPDAYRKLLKSANDAGSQSDVAGGAPPSMCRLEIQCDTKRNVAQVTAHYEFRIDVAGGLIPVGLKNARPTKIHLEGGGTPVVVPNGKDESFVFRADKPGEYRLRIECEVSLAAMGATGEHGFALGLPGSAVTLVERFERPAKVFRARINDRAIPAGGALVLGPAKTLEVKWQPALQSIDGRPLTIAESVMHCRVDDRMLVIDTSLTIRTSGEANSEIIINGPSGAKATCDVAEITELPTRRDTSAWRLAKLVNNCDEVRVRFRSEQPISNSSMAIAGFAVASAGRESGVVTFSTPPNFRVSIKPAKEIRRRESTEERRDIFDFPKLPDDRRLFDVSLTAVRGELEVTYQHKLAVEATECLLTTQLECKAIRRELDFIEIQYPAEWRDLRVTPPDVAEAGAPRVEPNGDRVLSVRFTDRSRAVRTIALEGRCALSPGATAASLSLPRVVNATERGGTISASSSRGIELRGAIREWEQDRVGEWERSMEPTPNAGASINFNRSVARADLLWTTLRNEQAASGIIEIRLGERQNTVRHTIRLPLVHKQVLIKGPAELSGRLSGLDGSTISQTGPESWLAQPSVVEDKEAVLTLAYTFSTRDEAGPITLPLAWPEGVGGCETVVRVWEARGGRLPMAVDGPWTEQPLWPTGDRGRLPSLNLRGINPAAPLKIAFRENVADATAVVIDREWIQAIADNDGVTIRARYFVRPLRATPLTFELPGDAKLLRPAVAMEGQRLNAQVAGRRLTIQVEPAADRQGRRLEIAYRETMTVGTWATFAPPRPLGIVPVGAARWQFAVADNWIPFEFSSSLQSSILLSWRTGLPAPGPGWSTAALSRWFAGDPRIEKLEEADSFGADLVGTAPGLEPISLLLLPRSAAVLVVSFGILAMGLIAATIAWTPVRLALVLLALAFAVLLGVFYAQPATQLLAAGTPGIVAAAFVGFWLAGRSIRSRQTAVFASPVRRGAPLREPLTPSAV